MPTARALSAIDPETFHKLTRHEMLRVSADGHALMTALGSAPLDRLSRKSLSRKSLSRKSISAKLPGAPTTRSPQ